jgi:glycosyltransferase involved in cell wall biosynthesis
VKFVFLQTGMTGYQDACLRALHKQGHQILNVFPGKIHNTEFKVEDFASYGDVLTWTDSPPEDELLRVVKQFDPDAIMMASWGQPTYRKVMASMRGRALRILFSSNIWENTPRQWIGRATHRVYLRPLYDCVFVPGDRSEWMARRLGFRNDQVIRGANSADVEVFDRGPRSASQLAASRRFLFSGRLMPYKGVSVLRAAYEIYRAGESDPWDVDVVGKGELAGELEALPGVTMHGFVQPEELAELMHNSACLVLPSFIDFFGVVVHEAATAGQVLICSDAVGATPYLLQDYFNGWTVPSGSVRALADAMSRVTALSGDQLAAMSEGSRSLAKRQSPTIWAQNLSGEVEYRRAAGDHLANGSRLKSIIRA